MKNCKKGSKIAFFQKILYRKFKKSNGNIAKKYYDTREL